MDLNQILNNWNYPEALDWYTRHGDGVLLPLLQTKTSFGEKRLKAHLHQLKVDEPKLSFKKSFEKYDLPKTASQEAKDLDAQSRRWYKAQAANFAQLKVINDPHLRKALALNIVSCFRDKIIPAWQRLRAVREGRELPVENSLEQSIAIELEQMNLKQLLQRRNSLRANISRDRKAKKMEKVERWQIELERVNQLLNAI